MNQRAGSWTWPVITIIAVAVSIVGSFIGSGALGGTPIAEAAGGALSADSTPLAPGGGAFSIWSVIYLGLAGYALWQLSPSARSSPRQRSLRPWAVASALLNAAWIWSVQLGFLTVSVFVIVALLIVLIRMLQLMEASAPYGRLDMLLTDGTFGLYLGWVTVATVANVAALIAVGGVGAFAGWEIAAAAVVLLAGGIGVGMAVTTRGRLAPALAGGVGCCLDRRGSCRWRTRINGHRLGRRGHRSRCTRVSREPEVPSSRSSSRAAWEERAADRPVNGFGIEEEFFLFARPPGLPATPSREQAAQLTAITAAGGRTSTEWLTCQVETATAILTDGSAALDSLRSFRRALSDAADSLDLDAVALGTAPRIPHEGATVTEGERYSQFAALAPGFAADQYINGMHVHVGIPDREAGVRALNGLRPWLPVLTALGANSPMWRGQDSGFASWRAIHYSRWMASGVPPHFHDSADYDARVAALVESDVVFDPGCLNWLARLPSHIPTLEVRACDVQLHSADAVTLALLTRALVTAAMSLPSSDHRVPPERFDIAQWQAAKFGLDHRLFDPTRGTSLSAETVVWELFAHVRTFFASTSEETFVRDGLHRILSDGTGAARQRAAFATGGMDGLLQGAAAVLPT